MKKQTIQIPESKALEMIKGEGLKVPYRGHAVKLKNGQIIGLSPTGEWFLYIWTLNAVGGK